MNTTPVSMDPRIRERRIEVQREAGRKRLRVLLLTMGAFVVLGVAYLIVQSPLLDVDTVRVVGARNMTPAQVRAAAEIEPGTPLLRVDTGAVARRVEALPWVRTATVSRVLPGTLRVSVTEYAPVAYVKNPAGGVGLIAPDGRVIARAATAPRGAVEIVGLRRVPAAGSLVSPPQAASVARWLPPALTSQIVAVDVGTKNVAVRLTRGGEIRLGTLDNLRAKGASALAVLQHVGAQPFAYLDVSTPEAPVVGHVARG